MYTYEFERICTHFEGWGPLDGNLYQTEDHQRLILNRAKDGWRYVGFIPTSQRGSGQIQEMELVFEKEVPEQ